MNKLSQWLLKQEQAQSAKSFAAFRIAFCLFLLMFIAHVSYYRPLIFNTIPHLAYNPFPAKLFLLLWALVTGFLLAGWQTKMASVINYLFIVIATFLFSNAGCGSFNDDLLRIGGFLLVIMPVGRNFSVDVVVKTVRFGAQQVKASSSLYYLAALLVSLGLMYLASGITKLYSPMWAAGLGLWIPASMPYNKWHSVDFFLNMEWLMKGINYVTMLWELLFLFMLFSKKWRLTFAATGVFFHLVIAILFPFPLLSFGAIAFYLLFIPDSFWDRFQSAPISLVINPANQRQQIFARALQAIHRNTVVTHHPHPAMTINGTTQRSNRKTAIYGLNQTLLGKTYSWMLEVEFIRLMVLAFADDGIHITSTYPEPALKTSFKRFWLAVFCFMLLSVQVFYSSYHLFSKMKGNTPKTAELKNGYHVRKDITDFSLKPSNLFRTLFGLNARGVFLDHSNTGTKTVFAVIHLNKQGDTTWLPFFDRNGYALGMNMNLAWSRYTFNSVCSGMVPNPLELEKALWLWTEKQRVKRQNIDFYVLKRTYIYPKRFEPDYQKKMAGLPWLEIGIAGWQNGTFRYTAGASAE
ncbi:MAG: HTTM domain-containing protein [Bacteroidota bacterium]